MSHAFGLTHWNAAAPKKPSTRRRPPSPGGGALPICQASQTSQTAPTQRNSGSSSGQWTNAEPRPAQTSASMSEKPKTMPSMCGSVARMP